MVDQYAGDKNGAKWGSLTVSSEINYYERNSTWIKQLIKNLAESSRINRTIAATGINPNAEFKPQATTTTTTVTTDYQTPYAALQKAVETNTITLLTESHKNTGLTPTRDELLFEQSTLAYEAGSTYAGSTIHADTAGVYLDITKTGEVNLQSGTVTVTTKDATYPLVLGGTMDADGNVYINGRSKNMLLGSNGQNIYPEEIEDKLNSLPLVGESIVVQRGDKLVGLVHPDYDEAKLLGLNNEDLKGVMEQNRQQLNQVVPAYSKVAEFEILEEEFEKTPKKSIKRYLYK